VTKVWHLFSGFDSVGMGTRYSKDRAKLQQRILQFQLALPDDGKIARARNATKFS
jgi:hypothetical protein